MSLFAPPADIATDVFAALPDTWQRGTETHEWVAAQPRGGPVRSLIEGPSFDRDGHLWCVDLIGGAILRVSPAGEIEEVLRYDGWPNGLKIHRDGRVFVADHKHGIMVLDPGTRRIAPFLERAGLARFKGVNDLFFAANGDLWFTDQALTGLHDPTGRLFRADPAGRVECLLDTIPSPNGLVMNLEEDAVYLAVTRANAVWRVPLARGGGITKVGVFLQLSGGGGPDGLALDEEGGLLVAHIGIGAVWHFDARGEPRGRIRTCRGTHTTNMAFGGVGNRTLFITESHSGSILRAELPVAGKPMFSHG